MRPGSGVMVNGGEVILDDGRIARVGKLLRRSKLDGIPHVIDILRGNMGLVTPYTQRTKRMDFVAGCTDEVACLSALRPGLTALAQVSSNIYLDFPDRYRFGVFHLNNFGLRLDATTILGTIGVVLFGQDKYLNEQLVKVV